MTLLLEYVPGIRELIYWQSAIQYALSVVMVMLLCGLLIRLHAESARPATYAWRTAAGLLWAWRWPPPGACGAVPPRASLP